MFYTSLAAYLYKDNIAKNMLLSIFSQAYVPVPVYIYIYIYYIYIYICVVCVCVCVCVLIYLE